jgi:hypothetical protein
MSKLSRRDWKRPRQDGDYWTKPFGAETAR